MDSPTRRQLVVGFLEPVEKNGYSANKPPDWMSKVAFVVLTNWNHAAFFFSHDAHALKLTGRKYIFCSRKWKELQYFCYDADLQTVSTVVFSGTSLRFELIQPTCI